MATRTVVQASVLALALATSAAAQTKYAMDYFGTQVDAACIATDPNNPGTYERRYQEPTNQCPGLAVFHSVKGAGSTGPWSTESFYIAGNNLKQMIELSLNSATQQITDYRAFRDQTTGSKGIIFLANALTAASSWSVTSYLAPYVEEHWTNSSGQPVCYNTQHSRVDQGSVTRVTTYWSGTRYRWLRDLRHNSLNPNTWYDVDTVTVASYWGGNVETYVFGRWQNPAIGTGQGVGLVSWRLQNQSTGQLYGSADNHYLVDCNVAVTCSTCPP
jgi:hypothetical protein